jgi:TPP-dependent pyruvate/acetoin dehydrogenase alpha subunit
VVAPYGFDRDTVSGSDVPAVYDAFGSFLEAARGGHGPFLLECLTYRRRGHYEGDQQKYRDAAAEQEWEERDPIAQLTRRALDSGWIDSEAAAAAEREATEEIEQAVAFARQSPFPEPSITADLVYAT